jgi:hypothetical protein
MLRVRSLRNRVSSIEDGVGMGGLVELSKPGSLPQNGVWIHFSDCFGSNFLHFPALTEHQPLSLPRRAANLFSVESGTCGHAPFTHARPGIFDRSPFRFPFESHHVHPSAHHPVVEDDDIVRMLIVDVLEELEFSVLEADDGESALNILEDRPAST